DDDDKKVVPDKTRSELLTAGSWKITAETINPAYDYDGDGTTETDLHALKDPCNQDDIIVFKADNTFSIEEGATKCDPTDDQIILSGTWAFVNNENAISLTTPFGTAETPITDLTESTLKIVDTFDENGVTYTTTTTYSH
ncbi:MAG: lipocalin family protein, partial [Hymenobacteraceae bacterium]|nr:lipocalin family protein [Hymenobacteraceae bacterium]MDX5395832.1 lipocalin family protein [Hymenobacteraceae bacterium]MDX5511887.1 lipocalin family protein [Hymenobacteraceae bacterium]